MCWRISRTLRKPADVQVFWGYALLPDRIDDFIAKPMEDCTGADCITCYNPVDRVVAPRSTSRPGKPRLGQTASSVTPAISTNAALGSQETS